MDILLSLLLQMPSKRHLLSEQHAAIFYEGEPQAVARTLKLVNAWRVTRLGSFWTLVMDCQRVTAHGISAPRLEGISGFNSCFKFSVCFECPNRPRRIDPCSYYRLAIVRGKR